MKNFLHFIIVNTLLLLINLQVPAQLQRFSFSETKMAAPFSIIFYDDDSVHAAITAQKCFKLVDEYVLVYSDYIDSSEINLLCKKSGTGGKTFVSAQLMDILLQAKAAYIKSNKSFDITLGPLTRLWRKARKENLFPDDNAVKEKLALTGFEKIIIDSLEQTVQLLQPNMQLDMGGIAQGYIVQKVISLLKDNNINNALVNASGDIAAIGKPPGKSGWSVAVAMPQSEKDVLDKKLLISNKAVTTSGDTYQFMEHNGMKYSHVINPVTGYGITNRRSVTVVADDATTADWFTKACSLLPVRTAQKIALELQADFLIIEIKKDRLIYYATKGFKKYWKK